MYKQRQHQHSNTGSPEWAPPGSTVPLAAGLRKARAGCWRVSQVPAFRDLALEEKPEAQGCGLVLPPGLLGDPGQGPTSFTQSSVSPSEHEVGSSAA